MKKVRLIILFRLLLILIVVVSSITTLKSQIVIMSAEADSLITQGTFKIYNCEFDEASKIFKRVIGLYPEHPAGYFLDAMVEWWRIQILREAKQYDKPFLSKSDKVIQLCDKLLERNPNNMTALFFKGGAHGYKGRYYSVREEWLNAANEGRLGYDILTKCWQQAPGNHDILLGTGIYNYFSVAIPEEMPVLKPIVAFFPKGDRVLGQLQLQAAARSARYASTEAKVVLMQIMYQFEKNYSEALKISEDLFRTYPNNAYFHRFLARIYVNNGMMTEWESSWRSVVNRGLDRWIGYDRSTLREGLYYVGLALMRKGKNDEALKYFFKCDEACRALDKKEQSGFMVKTAMYIGNIYDLQKKRKYALDQYQKVVKWKDYSGTIEEAKRYLKTPYGQ
jgi:tetratricopeptide (TPR) repeat protein